jgi:hypothetical protein
MAAWYLSDMVGWSRYIEFFLRVAMKFARRIWTGDWPVINATVVSSKRDECFTGWHSRYH